MSYRKGKNIANSLMQVGGTVSGAMGKPSQKNPTKQHPGQSSTKPKNYSAPKPKKRQTEKGNYFYSYGGTN